jgi:hypothetical protein
MGWILVVSEDERFQHNVVRRLRDFRSVVGATGEASARRIVGTLNVSSIIVDAADEIGRRFLSALASAPAHSVPPVITVGSNGDIPRFPDTPDLDAALSSLTASNVA